jgi:RimJ/RimL family protein N-acetyltransferase
VDVLVETERLVLRRFTDADLDLLVELDGDPEVMRYSTGGRPTWREELRDEVLPAFPALLPAVPGLWCSAPATRSSDRSRP